MREIDGNCIMHLGKEALIDSVIDSFSEPTLEQIRIHALICARADELGIGKQIDKMISAYHKQDEKLEQEYRKAVARQKAEIDLETNRKGEPTVTIDNFLKIMTNDPYYDSVKFNLLANRPELHNGKKIRPWLDSDTAASRCYIESEYHIHSESKHQDALRLLFRSREFHPIKDIVDCLEWDGVERIPDLLHKWLQAEDNEYTREVSRLIFAGGIHRLYNPGCKFDDVPVLIGTRQGEGKSSFIRWLAMNDAYYSEVTEFEGQRGIEQLEGAWICEIAELLALTRAKDQEGVKAYITRQWDKYRKPYDRQTEELPRRCVFIATTNNEAFLRDKTGNRRFYPVKTNSTGYWLFDHEQECRDYIIQCWAEAKAKFDMDEMPPYALPELLEAYRAAQENAMEDDWRTGAIEAYLERKVPGERVCIRQIAHEALSPSPEFPKDPTKKDANEISQIMSKMNGWVKLPKSQRLGKYGVQKCWEKQSFTRSDMDLPFIS